MFIFHDVNVEVFIKLLHVIIVQFHYYRLSSDAPRSSFCVRVGE